MTAPTPRYPLSLSVSDAARIAGSGRTAFYSAVKRGEIPSLTINGRIVIPTKPLCELFGVEPSAIFGTDEAAA